MAATLLPPFTAAAEAALVQNSVSGQGRILIAPTGPSAGYIPSNFGHAVAGAGDVNGDGYADVIIGASSAGSSANGRAYVYYGGPAADDVPDLTLTGPNLAGGSFGEYVSGAGDVNGDGFADLVVGSGAPQDGRAYVYLGGPDADDTLDLVLASVESGLTLASVAGSDLNGDGYSDMATGTRNFGSMTNGRAYVFFGGPAADDLPDLTLEGNDSFVPSFRSSVAAAGDVNGDGYSDLVVAADEFLSGPGHAYVHFGGPGLDSRPDVTLIGETGDQRFGFSVSAGGDVNGDGYDDVIIGTEGSAIRHAYLFYGGPDMDGVPDLTFASPFVNEALGPSVAMAGDLNGDGSGDVAINSVPTLGTSGTSGHVCVYLGGGSPDSVVDLTLAVDELDRYSDGVAGAGDFDGDGRSDLIVGTPGWDADGSEGSGRAYVIGFPAERLTARVRLDPPTINLKSRAPSVTASIVVPGFDPANIDVSSLRLAGSVSPILESAVVGPQGADGEGALMVKFGRGALEPLLTPGMNRLEITGSLGTGEGFHGVDSVRVIAPGRGPLRPTVSPNPFNPSAVLHFETSAPGPVRVRMFDVHGRLVHTLIDRDAGPPGAYEVRVDGRTERGEACVSGVYYLRVETADGNRTERIVIVK